MRFSKDAAYCLRQYNLLLEPTWKALLSNGEIIYQDDFDGSSWADLQQYCKTNQLELSHVTLEFYDNIVNILPPNAKGYFYRRGFLTSFLIRNDPTDSTPLQGSRAKTVVIGHFDGENLKTHTIQCPELFLWHTENRDKNKMIKDKIFEDKSLFLNSTKEQNA